MPPSPSRPTLVRSSVRGLVWQPASGQLPHQQVKSVGTYVDEGEAAVEHLDLWFWWMVDCKMQAQSVILSGAKGP
jgi:hypothetical protein